MEAFNANQRDFVDSMSRSFQTTFTDQKAAYLVLGFLFFLILLTIGTYLIQQNWVRVRGEFIYWARYFTGKSAVKNRVKSRLEITLYFPRAEEHYSRTHTLNLSPNGMFVRGFFKVEKAERFKFFIYRGQETILTGTAETVWLQEKWSPYHPTGMGCKFLDLSFEDQNKLKILLRALKESRAKPKKPRKLVKIA